MNRSSRHFLLFIILQPTLQGCWLVLSPTRKETSYSDRRFWCSYILFIVIIGGILELFMYKTRLASNERFSPSNKIHWEVGRAKDLSALLYNHYSHHSDVWSMQFPLHHPGFKYTNNAWWKVQIMYNHSEYSDECITMYSVLALKCEHS